MTDAIIMSLGLMFGVITSNVSCSLPLDRCTVALFVLYCVVMYIMCKHTESHFTKFTKFLACANLLGQSNLILILILILIITSIQTHFFIFSLPLVIYHQ